MNESLMKQYKKTYLVCQHAWLNLLKNNKITKQEYEKESKELARIYLETKKKLLEGV